MESIERFGSPQQPDIGSGDAHVVTMREFLAKPRVARDFQDLKADAQRLHSARQDSDNSSHNAAEAELEAGRVARADDDYRHHRLSFGAGVVLATLLILLDTLPANLAAQTFGLSSLPSWGITAVIVGALGAGMWAVAHFKRGWRRVVTICALAVGLVAIGALRYWFLWVTAGDALAAVLEAIALTVFTTLIVWLGVLVLGYTKSRQVSRAERDAWRARRQVERKSARETELSQRLESARARFLSEAQLFSFRTFQNEVRRTQFLDYVRVELER